MEAFLLNNAYSFKVKLRSNIHKISEPGNISMQG